jgi:hypothetical protein
LILRSFNPFDMAGPSLIFLLIMSIFKYYHILTFSYESEPEKYSCP